jgi:hypothetical protein
MSLITATPPTVKQTVTGLNLLNIPVNTSEMFIGYFRPRPSGHWDFTIKCDQPVYVWLGSKAIYNYTLDNADISTDGSSPVTASLTNNNLIGNKYYPIRILYGNKNGNGNLSISYKNLSHGPSDYFKNLIFNNPVNKGF